MRLRTRIADEKVRHQGRNAGRKQENVSLRAGVHLPHKAGQQYARKAEPDVQHRNAPEAEACRQEKRQHRNAVRLAAGKRVDGCTDGADNCRVQERPGKAAARRVKIAVGRLIRQRAEPQHPFDHLPAVRHGNRRDQAQCGKQPEPEADGPLGQLKLFFHAIIPSL